MLKVKVTATRLLGGAGEGGCRICVSQISLVLINLGYFVNIAGSVLWCQCFL